MSNNVILRMYNIRTASMRKIFRRHGYTDLQAKVIIDTSLLCILYINVIVFVRISGTEKLHKFVI